LVTWKGVPPAGARAESASATGTPSLVLSKVSAHPLAAALKASTPAHANRCVTVLPENKEARR
jgi:hypothetical protein